MAMMSLPFLPPERESSVLKNKKAAGFLLPTAFKIEKKQFNPRTDASLSKNKNKRSAGIDMQSFFSLFPQNIFKSGLI